MHLPGSQRSPDGHHPDGRGRYAGKQSQRRPPVRDQQGQLIVLARNAAFAMSLSVAGYDVRTVDPGREEKWLTQVRPDTLLIFQGMTTGWARATIHQVRAVGLDSPIIVFVVAPAERAAFAAEHAADHRVATLGLPISSDRLLAAVAESMALIREKPPAQAVSPPEASRPEASRPEALRPEALRPATPPRRSTLSPSRSASPHPVAPPGGAPTVWPSAAPARPATPQPAKPQPAKPQPAKPQPATPQPAAEPDTAHRMVDYLFGYLDEQRDDERMDTEADYELPLPRRRLALPSRPVPVAPVPVAPIPGEPTPDEPTPDEPTSDEPTPGRRALARRPSATPAVTPAALPALPPRAPAAPPVEAPDEWAPGEPRRHAAKRRRREGKAAPAARRAWGREAADAPVPALPSPLGETRLASTLVRRLLPIAATLHSVSEVATAMLELVGEQVAGQAATMLLPDEGRWRPHAGTGQMRPVELRRLLMPTHWLVAEVAIDRRGLLIADTDIVRSRLRSAPLASWNHLLAAPVNGVEGVVLMARQEEAFTRKELAVVIEVVARDVELLREAVEARALARQLESMIERNPTA